MESETGRHSRRFGKGESAQIDMNSTPLVEGAFNDPSPGATGRQMGVSTATRYRRFEDRDELLAAVAARGLHVYATMLSDAAGSASEPEQQLAEMAGVCVKFAARQSALFDAISNLDLDRHLYPELKHGWEEVDAQFAIAYDVCDGNAEAAKALADALNACANGHVILLVGRGNDVLHDEVELIAAKAVATARALILGRQALADAMQIFSKPRQ